MTRGLAALLLLAAVSGRPEAAGFNVYEMGTRATALGGAFTATADDPSAVFYNPAGVAWQEKRFAVSGNLSLIVPKIKFARETGSTPGLFGGDATGESKNQVYAPFGVYATYAATSRLAAGLGVYVPFGLGVAWDDPETFAGRSLSTNAQVRGFYLNPVATVRISDAVAVSAGPLFVVSTVKLESIETQPFGSDNSHRNVIDFVLEGTSGVANGFSAAVLVRPSDVVSVGVNYKSGVTNRFEDDDATLKQIETGIPAVDDQVRKELAAVGRSPSVSADLKYPDILAAGVRIEPAAPLALMGDFVWFQWSDFDRVSLEFSEPLLDRELRQEYRDGRQWRFGIEYAAARGIDLMAGLVLDETPQPRGAMGPVLPDADRVDYSVGVRYHKGPLEVVAAYMLVDFEERSTVVGGRGTNFEGFDGTYESVAHIPSLGVTWRFDGWAP